MRFNANFYFLPIIIANLISFIVDILVLKYRAKKANRSLPE
jgi:uncharacterized protein with PQ loop repeat